MNSRPHPAPTRSAARRATRIAFLVAGLGTASWAPMVPYAKARLGLDDAALGFVLLAMGLGSVLSMPLAGALAQRWGARPVVLGAGVLAAAALPWLAWAPTTPLLVLGLAWFGFFGGALDVAMNAHAVAVERDEGRARMSGFHGLFSVGGLAGSALMSALLAVGVPLLTAATAIAFLLALLLGLQRRRLRDTAAGSGDAARSGWTLRDGLLLAVGAMCFISFLAEGAMLDWSAVFLRDTRDLSASLAGVGYACFSVAMACGRLGGDAAVARLGPVRTVRIGAAVAAFGLALAVLVAAPWAALVGFALVGLGASNIVPVMFSTAGHWPGRAPAMALAMVTAIGYAGLLCGPAAIGPVARAVGLATALGLVAVLLLVVCASAALVRPRGSASR